MIPVAPQPEPATFDAKVRQPGLSFLAIRIEEVTGSATADHFAAKSKSRAGLAYEWSNYRLVCGTMNSRKQAFADVLDPFTLTPDTFVLDLTTAKLAPNPLLVDKRAANATINRLRLNGPDLVRVRGDYWTAYVKKDISVGYLKRSAPFVWYEANRQGLL